MKVLSITIFCFGCLQFIPPLHAQKRKKEKLDPSFYLLNKDWSGAKNLDEAEYFMQIIKENDSVYICRYYNKYGPMVKQESFADSNLSVPNGMFLWYNEEGNLDSLGYVSNGKKDKYWSYSSKGKNYLALRYEGGKLLEKWDYDAGIYTNEDGTNMLLSEKSRLDSLKADTIKPVQVEAKFPGGTKAWINFLYKKIQTSDRLANALGKGEHEAIFSFLITKTGTIAEVYLIKSCEWSGDAEIFNAMKEAPNWIPATQNGKPVIYRQKQSITFEVNY